MIGTMKWLFAAAVAGIAAAIALVLLVFAGSGDGDSALLGGTTPAVSSIPTASPSQATPAAQATSTPSPTPEPPPALDPTATATPAVASEAVPLSDDALLDAEYLIPDMDARVQFQDGFYHWVRQPGQTETQNPAPVEPMPNWASWLDPEVIATGDLDGDGQDDAAVIIRSQFGGTGVFVTLAAVHNDAGAPVHVATAPLGDRVGINAVAIENGEIILDMLTHADPGSPQWAGQCCPTVPTESRYRLESNDLTQVQ